LCEQLNLNNHFAGIPSYGKYKDEITPKFLSKSQEKEIYDPVLSFN
jgi:hypothetical protein